MNMKNVIIVSEEDRNIVQRADVECSSRMNLISFLIQNNVDINNERFKAYQDDYSNYFFAFEQEKTKLAEKYLNGLSYTSWNLNYNTCELTYEN